MPSPIFWGGYLNSVPGGDLILKFLEDPVGSLTQMILDFLVNPAQALEAWGPLIFAIGYQVFFIPVGFGTWGLGLSAPLWGPALIAVGLSSLGLLALIQPDAVDEAEPAPFPQLVHWRVDQVDSLPVVSIAPTVPATGVAPAPAPTAMGTAPAGAPAAGPAPLMAYAVQTADPGGGFTPTLREGTGARAPASGIAAAAVAAAAASAAERRRARRRRASQVKERGVRDEYLDMNSDADPDWGADAAPRVTTSGRGPVVSGFAGTFPADAVVSAGGLKTLSSNVFGDDVVEPMLPGNWPGTGGGRH